MSPTLVSGSLFGVHPKYQSPKVTNLHSREGLDLLYRKVLSAVARAQGFSETATELLQVTVAPEAWEEVERVTRHETAAYVEVLRSLVQRPHEVYLGLTSSDLQDTAEAVAWQLLLSELRRPVQQVLRKLVAADPGDRVARTHGVSTHERVPVKSLYARAARDLLSSFTQLANLRLRANLSGPVGEFSEFLSLEQAVNAAKSLDLELDYDSTQTADRHRLAEVAFNLAQLVGVYEQLATYHRLSAVVGEHREVFAVGEQKGSSSLPHKRNPLTSEQVCGLARVARSNLSALLETAHTQWWERDLTNSSVERTAWLDLQHLTFYLSELFAGFDFDSGWTPESNLPYYEVESPFHELNRRLVAGEHPEAVYREVQRRSFW
ncbi:adenylosuccinate lyase [Gordonia phage Ghobes]|uniref:Adenylosuccinate lyase n=1 Tax=Gordonia phage Ghobes TaxID=1887647 RepID=A0A1B3B081_9CAUD|nr:adenylosuccinate lyase [Gordonia phage Ghobes]AOE44413.1 adenylosuccinate lyase [Gordonia phage Ghobes]